MFHWTPEGHIMHSGFNFYCTRRDARLIYMSTHGTKAKSYYFRFRWKPWVLLDWNLQQEWDIVENYNRLSQLMHVSIPLMNLDPKGDEAQLAMRGRTRNIEAWR